MQLYYCLLNSKLGAVKWKIRFCWICIFRFLEVYIRKAIWVYYFPSGTSRVSVKMASISQSAFHIFLTLHRFEVQKKQWKIFQHRNIGIEKLNQSIKPLFYIDFWSSPQNVLKMSLKQKKQKEPQHVWGKRTLCVLTLYLVAYVMWQPYLFCFK